MIVGLVSAGPRAIELRLRRRSSTFMWPPAGDCTMRGGPDPFDEGISDTLVSDGTASRPSVKSELHANGDERRIERDACRDRDWAGQSAVNINRQPRFLDVDEELE